MNPYGLKPN
ncbi:hypothetical protein AB3S75_029968, partial [Citrus x aurantiifolia]